MICLLLLNMNHIRFINTQVSPIRIDFYSCSVSEVFFVSIISEFKKSPLHLTHLRIIYPVLTLVRPWTVTTTQYALKF